MDEDEESDEDVDVQGQPQVTFNLQEMDIATQQPNRRPLSLDAMDRSCTPMDDEIALVPASVERRVVISVSDVESYDSERQLIGDSTNEDIDNDDKGITHGIEMPSASESRAVEMDAPFAASTKAGPTSALAVENFYNAVGKAPHSDAIVPKQESGWWAARDEQ